MPFDDQFNRAGGIGASEMWKAYCWDDHLYYAKLGDRQGKEYVKPFTGNEATDLGHDSEPITLARGAKKAELTLLETDGKTKQHPSHDWIFSTVDAMAHDSNGELCTVEAKLVGYGPHLHWGRSDDGDEAIPNKVRAQVATQMAVENTELAYVFAWIGTEIRTYRLDRDHEWEEALFDRASTFWDWVIAEEGFPMGHGDATKRYLARKYEQSSKEMRVDETAGNLLREREKYKERVGESTAELALVDNHLRALIGADDGIEVPGVGKATFLFDRRGRRTLRVKMFEENENEQ